MKVLFIGDIVGRIGRRIVKDKVPYFVKKYGIDFVIANGENVTHGKGLIKSHYLELIDSGVDVVTLGNHYNSKSELARYIDYQDRLIRPLNLVNNFPGVGTAVYDVNGVSIRVTNLLGSVFINETVENPYSAILDLLSDPDEENATIHIIDFHAEATGEKLCFARALDGKVSAVIGTHTHVQTRDYQIFKEGTSYISDVGMTGAADSVLGFNPESSVNKLLHGTASRLTLDEEGKGLFSAVVIEFDEITGKSKNIFPIYEIEE